MLSEDSSSTFLNAPLNNQKVGLPSDSSTKAIIEETIRNALALTTTGVQEHFKSKLQRKRLQQLKTLSTHANSLLLSRSEQLANEMLARSLLVVSFNKTIDSVLDPTATLRVFPVWFHIDMDMFYCAVAQKLNPLLRTKPFVVGLSVVASANYLARKFGIRSGMPVFVAKKLAETVGNCSLTVISENWKEQHKTASAVKEIVLQYSTEYFSLGEDEYSFEISKFLAQKLTINDLDFSEKRLSVIEGSFRTPLTCGLSAKNENYKKLRILIENLVADIRNAVFTITGLTASVGVSHNKFLAKIAADLNKPDSFCVLLAEEELERLKSLAIRKIPGIGAATEAKLLAIGLSFLEDLQKNRGLLYYLFTGMLRFTLLLFSAGIEPISEKKTTGLKSISRSKTVPKTDSLNELKHLAINLCASLFTALRKLNKSFLLLQVSLSNANLVTVQKSERFFFPVAEEKILLDKVLEIVDKLFIKFAICGKFVGQKFTINKKDLSRGLDNIADKKQTVGRDICHFLRRNNKRTGLIKQIINNKMLIRKVEIKVTDLKEVDTRKQQTSIENFVIKL